MFKKIELLRDFYQTISAPKKEDYLLKIFYVEPNTLFDKLRFCDQYSQRVDDNIFVRQVYVSIFTRPFLWWSIL